MKAEILVDVFCPKCGHIMFKDIVRFLVDGRDYDIHIQKCINSTCELFELALKNADPQLESAGTGNNV